MLRVDWQSFGQAIRAQAVIDAKHLNAVRDELGLSHARTINAAQGKPVGTEIFLTLCHWMQIDPMNFAASPLPPADGPCPAPIEDSAGITRSMGDEA